MNYLPCIEIEPSHKQADSAIIWLHGLGASGDDFAPIVPQLKINKEIAVRFIFPHAPLRAIRFNGGVEMPAWYDFVIDGIKRDINPQDLQQTTGQIIDLIEREMERGIPSERIIIAGFSQGGAIAYHVALTAGFDLAGLMAMSTYLPEEDKVSLSKCRLDMPMHIYHGNADQVVPESMGQRAREVLKAKGFNPQYSLYSMEHSVCISQIRDIASFINGSLPALD